MALKSTQLLTELTTWNTFWGVTGAFVVLKTSPPLCANCIEILRDSNSYSPKDTAQHYVLKFSKRILLLS